MISSQHWDDWAQIIPVVGMIRARETSRHAVWGPGGRRRLLGRRSAPAAPAGPPDGVTGGLPGPNHPNHWDDLGPIGMIWAESSYHPNRLATMSFRLLELQAALGTNL